MLMLIAMTYEVELFIMVVVGLTLGHGLFNLKAPILESAEACCMGLDAIEETNPSSRYFDPGVVCNMKATRFL